MTDKMMSVRISTLRSRINKIVNGKLTVIPFPWRILSHLTQALYPGTSTIFCGSPGSAKSLMLCQALLFWHLKGIKVCTYMVEEDLDYHLMRILAQHTGQSGLTELPFIAENPEVVEEALNIGEEILHEMGKKIYASAIKAPTYREIGDWVEARAKEGYRIICVDPVTKARPESYKPFLEEQEMLDHIRRTMTAYNISCLLVTHPKQTFKGNSPNMADLAGGAAVSRFSQTLLWIQKHGLKPCTVAVPSSMGTVTEDHEHNRTIHVLKARNGKDEAVRIAAYFDETTLNTDELGVIVKGKK